MSLGQGNNAQLEFTERMWGYVCEEADSFEEGFLEGKRIGNRLEYQVTIQIDDLDALIDGPDEGPNARHVPMTGRTSSQMLFGEDLPLQKGAMFGLYWKVIRLIGDHSLYPDWQNLPVFMPKATTALMYRNYSWGLIVYAAFSQMDPFFKFNLEGEGLEVIRLFSLPLRETLLEAARIGELTWEGLSGLLSAPSLKDLQQLLDLLAGNAAKTKTEDGM